MRRLWLGLMVAAAGGVAAAIMAARSCGAGRIAGAARGGPVEARYVGVQVCAECHQVERDLWRGSHHDLAMQEATAGSVRGDFGDASFTYHGVTSTFLRRGGEFHVRTDGPDGALHDYRVAYTFGVEPLQQYLVEFPGGRFQALGVCWDTRPQEQGGQRWFHLYPDEDVTYDDVLHWTGPYHNWNHSCAECHSTNVHKNYDAARNTYATSWSEMNVSCEACHGPGSQHVAWAQRNAAAADNPRSAGSTRGLVVRLGEDEPGFWIPDPATGIARRDRPRTARVEIETCARCHSRRGTLSEDFVHGGPPADTHRLALLEPTLYEADGQIKDEVYEYGSFIQSRMHGAGVTCSDCHDPHSLKTAPGNSPCLRCHTPERFDTPEHHFHTPGERGSGCVDCHMPTRNYMVVHARHDHSFRVPRPDQTVSIGTPNACNGCHADRTPQWAADEIARRTSNPSGKSRRPHFAVALAAGRRGLPEAEPLLRQLLGDASQPAIARATAAEMLAGVENQGPLVAALGEADPLVRDAAVGALNARSPAELTAWLAPLLSDPVRLVRIDAARRLAAVPDLLLTPDRRAARERAMREYMAVQHLDADRAESHVNLGGLHAEHGDAEAAEREYLAAIRLSPRIPMAYVNLADLYRQLGRDEESLRVLHEGSSKVAGSADIAHALGLALVRGDRLGESIPFLERAAALAPDDTRYAYIYGVALETAGPPGRGIDVLKRAHERRPNDGDVLSALVAYSRALCRLDDAVEYAGRLAALRPDDPGARGLLESLKAERAGAGEPGPPPTERHKSPRR